MFPMCLVKELSPMASDLLLMDWMDAKPDLFQPTESIARQGPNPPKKRQKVWDENGADSDLGVAKTCGCFGLRKRGS